MPVVDSAMTLGQPEHLEERVELLVGQVSLLGVDDTDGPGSHPIDRPEHVSSDQSGAATDQEPVGAKATPGWRAGGDDTRGRAERGSANVRREAKVREVLDPPGRRELAEVLQAAELALARIALPGLGDRAAERVPARFDEQHGDRPTRHERLAHTVTYFLGVS
ncbi:hypothetical protein ABZX12_38245 [Kribbella sp. NPDC003505]|uniref:hypothetical protein n=1 Tax=Kribbella sp. NPDC003505 TaxID=3154448 RepID=UPI0033A354F8